MTGGAAVAVAALLAGGCSGGEGPSSLMTASLAAASGSGVHAAPPTEVYSRIARGALKCWFGPNGAMKATHVFHADAESPVKGGAAEIVVFARDQGNQNPRGLRALRIVIGPAGEGAHVGVEILRPGGPIGDGARADVARWAGGSSVCGEPISQGWSAAAAPPPAATNTPASGKRAKRPKAK